MNYMDETRGYYAKCYKIGQNKYCIVSCGILRKKKDEFIKTESWMVVAKSWDRSAKGYKLSIIRGIKSKEQMHNTVTIVDSTTYVTNYIDNL